MVEPGTPVELEIRPGAASQMRVAIVIVSGAAIALTLIWLLTGGGTVLFSPHTTLVTYVPDAAGLGKGSEVRLSGIPIGNVTKIDISGLPDPQHIVRVDMKVDARFLKNIPSDSQATISADTLIGDQFVSIDEGTSATPIKEGATIATEPVAGAIDRADLIKALQQELSQANDIVTQMSSPDTQLGAFVLGSKEYDQVLMRVSAFQRALHTAIGPQSQLGPILFSETLYNDIRRNVEDVDKTLASIQRGEGTAGRLFASDDQYNDFLRQLRDLRKSLAEASKNVDNDEDYRKIKSLLAETDATISAFSVNPLMRDARLYESLTESLKNVQKLLADLRAQPQKYLRIKM
jgi:phospholipid/cholesterol/gamma-HCH transport system substrate-binding protein